MNNEARSKNLVLTALYIMRKLHLVNYVLLPRYLESLLPCIPANTQETLLHQGTNWFEVHQHQNGSWNDG